MTKLRETEMKSLTLSKSLFWKMIGTEMVNYSVNPSSALCLMGLRRVGNSSGAKRSSEVFAQGVEPDAFGGQIGLVVTVQLAPALGVADKDPVGGLVAGACEAPRVDEGFQQNGSVGVAVVPVLGELTRGHGQHFRGHGFLDSTQGRIKKRALLTIS